MRGDAARDAEQVADVEQPPRLERRAFGRGGGQRRTERRDVGGRHATGLRVEPDQVGRHLQPALGLVALGRRNERTHRIAAGVRTRICRDRVEHAGQLESFEIAGPQGPRV
jgi:hypothetical protein